MTVLMDAEQEAVIGKVRKLLALANNNSNEAEAQSATAKAMELLAAYNLDMAILNQTKPKDSKRDDKKRSGGLYSWQRDLWYAVAELNFCRYFFIRGLSAGSKYEHQIIGRAENVIATELMSEYLQDTIERLTVEYGKRAFPGKSRFIRELIAYREGMAYRLADRLRTLRAERIKAERDRAAAATAGYHGSNALVLADVIQTEQDLNEDYINGWEPGTTAKRRAEQQERQRKATEAYKEEMRKQEEWDKAHPVEAAERKAKEAETYAKWAREDAAKAARRKTAVDRPRRMTSREERMSSHEFYAGYEKGKDVGLDRQIGTDNTRRIE